MQRQPTRTDSWWWFAADGSLQWGFTARRHGASDGPWGGLNLARHVGDDDAAVTQNRAVIAGSVGVAPSRLRFMEQVHGADVVRVNGSDETLVTADAMFTSDAVALAVMVADCVPVLLADDASGLVGVAHAGRPGMVAGVVPAVVEAMRGAGAADLRAVVGPSICPRCYEVPGAMRDDVARVEPTAASITGWGTPAVDVAAGVLAQLARCSVPTMTVPGCTAEQPDLYSYRRDGTTGRFAGVVYRRGV